jgi:hypothetical protein
LKNKKCIKHLCYTAPSKPDFGLDHPSHRSDEQVVFISFSKVNQILLKRIPTHYSN